MRHLTWIAPDGTRVDLTDETGGLIVRHGAIGLDAPPVDFTTHPGTEGSVLSDIRLAARTLALPLLIDGNVRARVATLARQFDTRRGRGQLEHVDDILGRTRTLRDIVYSGGLTGDDGEYWEADDWTVCVLNLEALDPWWYGEPWTVFAASPNAPNNWNSALPWNSTYPYNGPGVGISVGYPWNAVLPWNSSLPWNGGAQLPVTVGGDGDVWPTIVMRGPAVSAEIVLNRTGQRLALRDGVTLPAGQELVAVNEPGINRGVTLNGADAWDFVSLDSSVSMLLRAGDVLTVLMTGTGAPSHVRVTAVDRWLTP